VCCGRVADNGGWFCVALDSVKNGSLVRAPAHILCGTVRVKQVDRIRAAFNVTHFNLAVVLVWFMRGVADTGDWVPCGLGFGEQWNVGRCSSVYFVWNSSC